MKKFELIAKYKKLCEKKGMSRLDINSNSTKGEFENAINCLECTDSELNDYMVIIKLVYPNTYRTINNNGDFKTHYFNRLYVYDTARMCLNKIN